jgi:hypothetical protein
LNWGAEAHNWMAKETAMIHPLSIAARIGQARPR